MPSILDRMKSDEPADSINVLARFPMSDRFMAKRSGPWFLAAVGLIVVYLLAISPLNPFQAFVSRSAPSKFFWGFVVIMIIAASKLTYAYLFMNTFSFRLEGGSFFIKKGVILRSSYEYPITSINNTLMRRDFLDSCLGLCTIQLATAHEESDDFAAIKGLTELDGRKLQKFVHELIKAYQPSRVDIMDLNKRLEQVAAGT